MTLDCLGFPPTFFFFIITISIFLILFLIVSPSQYQNISPYMKINQGLGRGGALV